MNLLRPYQGSSTPETCLLSEKSTSPKFTSLVVYISVPQAHVSSLPFLRPSTLHHLTTVLSTRLVLPRSDKSRHTRVGSTQESGVPRHPRYRPTTTPVKRTISLWGSCYTSHTTSNFPTTLLLLQSSLTLNRSNTPPVPDSDSPLLPLRPRRDSALEVSKVLLTLRGRFLYLDVNPRPVNPFPILVFVSSSGRRKRKSFLLLESKRNNSFSMVFSWFFFSYRPPIKRSSVHSYRRIRRSSIPTSGHGPTPTGSSLFRVGTLDPQDL